MQTARRVKHFVSKKSRAVELALLSLAAANLFLISSAVSFYWFAHKH